MSKRKYQTEEERREAKRLQAHERYLRHRDEILNAQKERYAENKEEILEYQRKYREANNERINQQRKSYREKNSTKLKEKRRIYYVENREKILEYREKHKPEIIARQTAYRLTKKGLSMDRMKSYLQSDREHGRQTTITREWIMDHIFSSSCIYCGESDWHKLGCDRKDNSIGHTPENCVPACWDCNNKRKRLGFLQFVNRPWYLL